MQQMMRGFAPMMRRKGKKGKKGENADLRLSRDLTYTRSLRRDSPSVAAFDRNPSHHQEHQEHVWPSRSA